METSCTVLSGSSGGKGQIDFDETSLREEGVKDHAVSKSIGSKKVAPKKKVAGGT